MNEQNYKPLSIINNHLQQNLNEIKTSLKSLNNTEDILLEKIKMKYQDLRVLNREYTNIVDTYTQIIRASQNDS